MSHSSALPRGTRLHNGAYAIGEVLGQGGFGITYKGGDMALKRYVAIKEYFPHGALRQGADVVMADDGALRRGVAEFLNEARVLSRFHHPGIVGVAGTFEANNTAYMVMEWIEGETLDARIQSKKRLDEWEVLDIGSRLASALETVHGAGILHRDIKPDNIILRKAGAVLIDFGTARSFDGSATKMTQIVTPGYAPLEQYAAQAKRGPASDIYALGATLYHALSGHKPVAATDRAADIALPNLRALLPGLTPMFASAIMGALEMEFARRPQSAGEFEAQLKGQKSPGRRPPIPSPQAATAPGTAAIPLYSQPNADEMDKAGASAALINLTLKRHSGPVTSLAFAPDGETLVSGGADGKLCLWNWQDKMNPATAAWSAHQGGVLALAYSPDGAFVASGGRDERVNIWDGTNLSEANRQPLAKLTDCDGVVRDLSFCPARRELAVADASAVTLWDANSGAIKARRNMGALAVSWAPDGAALAVCGIMDGTLQLWDGNDLSERGRIGAHERALTSLAWSPDGKWIATTGADSLVRVWDAAQGTLAWEHNLGGVPESVAWSPDSRLVATAKADSIYIRTFAGAVFRSYALRRLAGNAVVRGRIDKVRFSPLPPPPYDYVIAAASRDCTVDVCRIRLQGGE